MTTSNLDLARECGAAVENYVTMPAAPARIVFKPDQLDVFAERIRADALASAPAQPDHRAVMQQATEDSIISIILRWNDSQETDVPQDVGVMRHHIRQALATEPTIKDFLTVAQPSPAAVEPVAVYLVSTGEITNGMEQYTRHDVRPPMCDAEKLYTAPQPLQQERQPLTDEKVQAGHDAADIAPTDSTIGTFIEGVRFAEATHGITAQQGGEQ